MRKTFIVSLCVLAVVLWVGTKVFAQDKDQPQNPPTDVTSPQGTAPNVGASAPQPQKPEPQNAGKAMEDLKKQQGKMAKKADEMAAKGKGQQQRLEAFQKQLLQERDKHMARQARLARIRELAVKKGDNEMVARVDKLIAKENSLFDRKSKRLQQRSTGAEQGGPAVPPPQGNVAPKPPEGAGPASAPSMGGPGGPGKATEPGKEKGPNK